MREPETQRLKLRRLEAGDAQTMFDSWTSDPEVPKYMTWYAHTDVSQTERILAEWLGQYGKPECYRWGIELKDSRTLIGMIDVVDYTDGIPEATDANEVMFGTDRMLKALNMGANTSPKEILYNVRAEVDAFVDEAEQFDDLTMLCIEYKGF